MYRNSVRVRRDLTRTRGSANEAARGGGSRWRPPIGAASAWTLLALLVAPTPVAAGSIGLGITAEPALDEHGLAVRLEIHNSGDEDAHAVSPALHFRDQIARGAVIDLLGGDDFEEIVLRLPADEIGTGRWPYRVVIDYEDANKHRFQALHVATVSGGQPPPGKMALFDVVTPRLTLAESGSLKGRVKNLSREPRTVTLEIHLPDEIELAEPIPSISLAGWEDRPVNALLVNRTGLSGSRYAVFVSAEYDDGDVHHTVLTPATLEIVNDRIRSVDTTSLLLGFAAGLLMVVWAAPVIWRRFRHRGSHGMSPPARS
jgi:hypothetical protein